MQSPELIKRKIKGTEGLHSIVRTMKILAAVNIRQYEKILLNLEEYHTTVEMGLQVVLQTYKEWKREEKKKESGKTGVIIFGSDMGMCGQFNENIAAFTEEKLGNSTNHLVIAVGEKILARLDDTALKPGKAVPYPANLAGGAGPILHELLFSIENWRNNMEVESVLLFYNKPVKEGITYHPRKEMLLPIDPLYLEELRKRKWESGTLPVFNMKRDELFSALARNHFYIALYRAFVDSLTSESIARMVSMQAAEKHINERLDELNLEFNQERQNAITSEILDIIAGVEALEK